MKKIARSVFLYFFFNDTATTEIYTLSLHDALPISRAIAVDPLFILFDEPFAGIDPLSVIELKKTIKQLTDRNIGLIITDHNVRETLSITDRAYIINEGRIFAHGVPTDLIADEKVKKAYLGEEFTL